MKGEQNQNNKLRILEEQRTSWEYVMPYVAKAFGEKSQDYDECQIQLMEIRQDIANLKEKIQGKNKKK